uniref:immunity protein Imm33 domain-containing protein n=1 Tax=Acinetobacter sp. D009 TaxID=3138069 RepID=UPI00406D35E3
MNSVIDAQKCNCMKFNSKFVQPSKNEMVAVALDSLGKIPNTGIRNVLEEGENISWFFYCGEFSEDDDFFKPIHISHLENYLPEVIPYLALEEGFRFVIDKQGYEDVWKEEYRLNLYFLTHKNLY